VAVKKKAAKKTASKKSVKKATPKKATVKKSTKKAVVEEEAVIKKPTLPIKKILEVIEDVIGPDAVPVVKYLADRENVSEFVIAEKTKLDMQSTRNILYRLNSHNVAMYIRKKDRQKGWYISYWTFNKHNVPGLMRKLKEAKVDGELIKYTVDDVEHTEPEHHFKGKHLGAVLAFWMTSSDDYEALKKAISRIGQEEGLPEKYIERINLNIH